jgi:pilus assembly protein CpaB
MKQKAVLIIALLVGIAAYFLTQKYLRDERDRLYKGAEKIRVLAAAKDLPSGHILKFEDLGAKSVFKTAVGENIFKPEDMDGLLGKKLLFPVRGGEPLLAFHVDLPTATRGGLAGMIGAQGLRAVSISVGGAAAVSSLVRPNNRVDILGTFTFPSRKAAAGQNETVTLTLLQDVTVLAVGNQLATDLGGRSAQSSYSMVTLEVTPREAEVLVFAQQAKGQLYLTLRRSDDASFEKLLPEVDFEAIEKNLPELNDYRQRNVRRKQGP